MENDETLLRNAGTTRNRRPEDKVEELELEVAIARNVRQLRQNSGLSVGEMAARIEADLGEDIVIESRPRLEGRQMVMMIAPKKK